MQEIEELGEKYIVIKREDIGWLSEHNRNHFWRILGMVRWNRESRGKQPNNYVVLNLEDKINVGYLLENIPDSSEAEYEEFNLPVKDMSVILINSILAATETHK
jgi:hypothetical protein